MPHNYGVISAAVIRTLLLALLLVTAITSFVVHLVCAFRLRREANAKMPYMQRFPVAEILDGSLDSNVDDIHSSYYARSGARSLYRASGALLYTSLFGLFIATTVRC
jgi:hypothetical protein